MSSKTENNFNKIVEYFLKKDHRLVCELLASSYSDMNEYCHFSYLDNDRKDLIKKRIENNVMFCHLIVKESVSEAMDLRTWNEEEGRYESVN